MKRRTFTFASLALAMNGPAQAAGHGQSPAGMLKASWTHTVADGLLVLQLKAANQTPRPVSVMSLRGSLPGSTVRAYMAGAANVELARVVSEASRRERLSRALPRSSYAPIAAGAEADLGMFSFTLPAGAEKGAFIAVAHVHTEHGDSVHHLSIPAVTTERV